ncbi:MAG TPA: ATP-binding protein [Polyangiaceae bacterium]
MISKQGSELVLELLARIAAGEAGVGAEPTGDDETLDAVVVGLGMLSEELDAERVKRAEAEALLIDERDAYRRSPGLLCSIDARTLRILKCNETLADAVGFEASELVGKSVGVLFDGERRSFAEGVLRAAAAGRADAVPELVMRGARGDDLRVSTTMTLSHEPTPRLRIVWTDVTKERRLEAQLIQAQKMQAVGRLSGGVAHDFNNILGIIMASVSFLKADGKNSPTFEQDLELIEQATKRGADLTMQLLTFARQQVARSQRVELGALVREADRMLRRLIGESISFSIDVPDVSLNVLVDPSQLMQVLLNLVVNARDAVQGHGRITVGVEHRRFDADSASELELEPGEYAVLSVTDNGPGMSPEVLAQAFDPFFTTKASGEGTGLGLSVCYGIVRQAGGQIQLSCDPGGGTTVTVALPLDQELVAATHESFAADAARTGHELVLLVEDDATLRQLTARLLERSGYRVLSAANGADALELMTHHEAVDLIVTDAVLPKLDGRALVEELFRKKQAQAALYLSGYTATPSVQHGAQEDGVHFLAKPFTPDQLLSAVRRSMGEG